MAHSIGGQKARVQRQYKKRIIKSRTEYEVTVAAGSTSATQALSPAVNPKRSIINFKGFRTTGGTYNGAVHQTAAYFATVTDPFDDGANVTVSTNSQDGTNARTAVFEVIEFHEWALAADIEHFSITLTAATSNTYNLARAVNTDYAHLTHNGQNTTSTAQNQSRHSVRMTRTSSVVTATRDSSNDNATVYGSMIEWSPDVVKSVQQATITFPSGATQTATATISAIDEGSHLLFWSGCSNNAFQDALVEVGLSGTTLTATAGVSANNSTRVATVFVVEFHRRAVKRSFNKAAQQIDLSSATDDVALSPAVDRGHIIHTYVGMRTDNNSSNVAHGYATVSAQANDNVRATRGGNSALYLSVTSWTMLELYA